MYDVFVFLKLLPEFILVSFGVKLDDLLIVLVLTALALESVCLRSVFCTFLRPFFIAYDCECSELTVRLEVMSFNAKLLIGASSSILAAFWFIFRIFYSLLLNWKVEYVLSGSILRHLKQSCGGYRQKKANTGVTLQMVMLKYLNIEKVVYSVNLPLFCST